MVIQIIRITKDLLRNPLQALELVERLNADTPLFLLKDFNRFLTDLSISRKLRNISLKLQPKTIILLVQI
jgi:hypothetical protein